MCVAINEIESGIWDEIDLLASPREIEWQLCIVKLNECPQTNVYLTWMK